MANKPYSVHILHPGYARTFCGKSETGVHKKKTKEEYNRFFIYTGQTMKNVCKKCLEAMERSE